MLYQGVWGAGASYACLSRLLAWGMAPRGRLWVHLWVHLWVPQGRSVQGELCGAPWVTRMLTVLAALLNSSLGLAPSWPRVHRFNTLCCWVTGWVGGVHGMPGALSSQPASSIGTGTARGAWGCELFVTVQL